MESSKQPPLKLPVAEPEPSDAKSKEMIKAPKLGTLGTYQYPEAQGGGSVVAIVVGSNTDGTCDLLLLSSASATVRGVKPEEFKAR